MFKTKSHKKVKFFHPQVETGWHKDLDIKTRRELVLKAHKGDMLAAGRSMQALANVTKDKGTKLSAGADARYFYYQYKKTGGYR